MMMVVMIVKEAWLEFRHSHFKCIVHLYQDYYF